jgi:hypothetical protein
MKKKIILQTKQSLIAMCLNKMTEYFAKTDKEAFNIITKLLRYQHRLFEAGVNVIN